VQSLPSRLFKAEVGVSRMRNRLFQFVTGFLILGSCPLPARAEIPFPAPALNHVAPGVIGADRTLLAGNPSPINSLLRNLSNEFDMGLLVGAPQLAPLTRPLTGGECVNVDPRIGQLARLNHTLFLEKNPATGELFVYGTPPNLAQRPEGLGPVNNEGNFLFDRNERPGTAQIKTTLDQAGRPILVTFAKTFSGVVQYCHYPLQNPLLLPR
jgi:hypothetical protein